MDKQTLFEIQQEAFTRCVEICKKKNHDYAGDGDALKNFKLVEYLGICDAETGVLVRMCDKISRLANIYKGGAEVSESIDDTLDDNINYSNILRAVIYEKKKLV